MQDDFNISIDLGTAQLRAEQTKCKLLAIRQKFNLAKFEYTKTVIITPLKIPFSHPNITLSTFTRGELALLSNYLHEQMHWYLTWYSHAKPDDWAELLEELKKLYPSVPSTKHGGASDEYSTYLHLVINWLEIETVSQFISRADVKSHVIELPFYHWIYDTVLSDWSVLEQLFLRRNLLPIKSASEMSADELLHAGYFDEESTKLP